MKDKDNVYISRELELMKQHEFKIEGADSESFIVLWELYSKDKDNIFYDLDKIEIVDYNTFEMLKEGFSRDKYNLYYRWEKIEWVYPTEDFRILYERKSKGIYGDYSWLICYIELDNKVFYLRYEGSLIQDFYEVKEADADTFKVLNSDYARIKIMYLALEKF